MSNLDQKYYHCVLPIDNFFFFFALYWEVQGKGTLTGPKQAVINLNLQ